MTTETKPNPPVPADVDLRGFEFMPLFGDRLMGSETWIRASAEAKVACLRLWWRAYAKEFPAGSLPDSDELLAEYAGYGNAMRAWKKVKPAAMRGFYLCSDNRLYHPFVSEIVMEAWKGRVAHQLRTIKGRIAATEKRLKEAKTDAERLHIDGQLQQLKRLQSSAMTESVTDPVRPPGQPLSQGPRGRGRGTGRGQGQGEGEDKEKQERRRGEQPPEAPAPKRAAAIAILLNDLERKRGKAGRFGSQHPQVIAWADAGVTDEQLIETHRIAAAERDLKGDPGALNPGFFDVLLAKVLNPTNGRKVQSAVTAAVKPWFITASGIEEKGREYGLEPGDDWQAFRLEVYKRAGVTLEQAHKAEADHR